MVLCVSLWISLSALLKPHDSSFKKHCNKLLNLLTTAIKCGGMAVDDFVLQLIGLRNTEPDMTISYPGFLYLLMELDNMIHTFQDFV
ncbi:unnamed protein product [Oncorhynchus mykiss]|uniref:Uncharacterized protein n=1 Tax=Oncorhynchus mykiss TaxID=8022 RepID=A0A060WK42_ONCMY|nr:unnamed protein product [Oncorhynchus mykiss]